MPAAGAWISKFAFSVSISAMGSPSMTSAPAGRSHATSVPSTVYIPMFGTTIEWAISTRQSQQITHDSYHLLRPGSVVVLKNTGKWHGRVRCGNDFNWSVEPIKATVGDARSNVSRHGSSGSIFIHHDQPPCLHHRFHDGGFIERRQCHYIHYFGINSVGSQLFGGFYAYVGHPANATQGNVFPIAHYLGATNRYC